VSVEGFASELALTRVGALQLRRIAEEKLGLADKALDAKKDVLKTLVDEVMASQTENEPAGAAEAEAEEEEKPAAKGKRKAAAAPKVRGPSSLSHCSSSLDANRTLRVWHGSTEGQRPQRAAHLRGVWVCTCAGRTAEEAEGDAGEVYDGYVRFTSLGRELGCHQLL
jgi:hypothetical protein